MKYASRLDYATRMSSQPLFLTRGLIIDTTAVLVNSNEGNAGCLVNLNVDKTGCWSTCTYARLGAGQLERTQGTVTVNLNVGKDGCLVNLNVGKARCRST